jgi:ActR/RegA family two-component response regulator
MRLHRIRNRFEWSPEPVDLAAHTGSARGGAQRAMRFDFLSHTMGQEVFYMHVLSYDEAARRTGIVRRSLERRLKNYCVFG